MSGEKPMSAQHGYSSYSSNTARYASAGVQVAMLLALASRHMEAARDAIKAGEIEARFNATEKCSVIISGLRGCLNRDTAEAAKMSETLDSYYGRMMSFIAQINIKNDLALCEAVVESLRAMSSTWREIQARADEAQRSTPTDNSGAAGNAGGNFSA